MKILDFQIVNFRGVRHACLSPGNATLLLGLNGQGKSTILQAVSFLLFGGAIDAGGKRILVADLIGPHGNDASVMATIETPQGNVIAEARITPRGVKAQFVDSKGVGLYSPNAEAARIAFWAACGIDPERAAVACNPREYLMGGGIASVLSRLDGGGIDPATLRDDCGEHWGFVERLANAHRTGLASVAQLDELGKVAYNERTSTKRILADAEKRAALATEKAAGAVYDPAKLEGAHQQMRVLETELADLRVRLGRAQAQAEAAANAPDYDALRAELGDIRDKMQAEHDALVETRDALRATAREAEQAHVKAAEFVKGKESALNASARLVASVEAQIELLKQRATVAERNECPTCGAKMKKADHDTAKRAVSKAEADLVPVVKAHAEAEAALEAARADAEAKREALIQANTQASRTQARIVQLFTFLGGDQPTEPCDHMRHAEEIGRILKAPRPEPVDTAEVQAQIDAVEARIAKGREIIAQHEAARDAASHAGEAEAFRAEVAALDWVVEAFKQGAVSKRYSGSGLEAFAAEASAVLEPYGYGLSVAVDGKTTHVLLHLPDGSAVPYAWASKGQRVLMEWAITTIAPGAVACVDDLDALSGAFKSIAVPQIAARREGTTLAAATWGMPGKADAEQISAAMGLPVVWVEQGAQAREVAA